MALLMLPSFRGLMACQKAAAAGTMGFSKPYDTPAS
jgi:hypothetical protein